MQTPPTRKPRNPLVFVPGMLLGRFDVLGDVVNAFETYGDVYQYRYKGNPSYMIRHPNHIYQVLLKDHTSYEKSQEYKDDKYGIARFFGQGLLTSNGSFWKRQRQMVQPAFHRDRIAGYAGLITQHANEHLLRWQAKELVDIRHEMWTLTLKIIVDALFTHDLTNDGAKVGEAMDIIQAYVLQSQYINPRFPTWAAWRARKASQWLDDVVSQIIAQRLKSDITGNDLLGLLLQAKDDDGISMTSHQIRDELITLILAGHETTANAMTWIWVLLSQHPDIEQQLHEELDEVLARRLPTLSDLPRLPFTDMVVQEALRLYPPAYYISRTAVANTSIGEYEVPCGTEIGIAIFAAHRDPRWWDNPNEFRPERWQSISKDDGIKHAYLPFGLGPRVCIGNSLAAIEMRLLLATIAQQFSLHRMDTRQVMPNPGITLRPRGSLTMRAVPRK